MQALVTDGTQYADKGRLRLEDGRVLGYKNGELTDVTPKGKGWESKPKYQPTVTQADVDNLRSVIAHHVTAEPMTLYRGLGKGSSDFTQATLRGFATLPSGAVIPVAKGFGSTTATASVMNKFGGSGKVSMVISVPEGAHAFPMPDRAGEDEVLLRDGAKIRVDSVDTHGVPSGLAGVTVHATLVHDGFGRVRDDT